MDNVYSIQLKEKENNQVDTAGVLYSVFFSIQLKKRKLYRISFIVTTTFISGENVYFDCEDFNGFLIFIEQIVYARFGM